MRTAGVDLSSQERNTAACVLEWTSGAAQIVELETRVGDRYIRRLVETVDKLGIDIPLGWPLAFVEAMASLAGGRGWPASYNHGANASYRLRETDEYVRRETGLIPLSVSTDRIAIPTMRAAALLAPVGGHVALDGSRTVMEVYPALALRRWGLPFRKYKGTAHADRRRALVAQLAARTSDWLRLSASEVTHLEASDHLFDALVAALVARAGAIGRVAAIPEAHRDAARREGWIALPDQDSLERLAGPGPGGETTGPPATTGAGGAPDQAVDPST